MSRRTKVVSDLPLTVETFRRVGRSDAYGFQQDSPSVLNGDVRIRKYRVTFEAIEETKDVLQGRIRQLWRECDNHHHRRHLADAAEAYGMTLDPHEYGVDAPKEHP